MKILEENLDGIFLTVLVEVPLRITTAEKVRFVGSKDIITLLDSKYKVINVVKDNRLSNSMRGSGKQKGSWIFQIEEAKIRKPRTRKTPATPKKPTTATSPQKTPPTETKPSTKTSIRGRMSKIVKDKLSDK